jgi:hypothetical protein
MCNTGFSGSLCEEDVNDCTHNPCQNGGKCLDRLNDFECRCVPGFVGVLCQDNVDDCQMAPCANGGVCRDLVNDFACTCKSGFTGKDCRINVNECEGQPCLNSGVCTDLVNNYQCTCTDGFQGKNCEHPTGVPIPTVVPGTNTESTGPGNSVITTDSDVATTTDRGHPHSRNVSGILGQNGSKVGGMSLELLLGVCLGAGVPLVLVIIIVTLLLCRKKRQMEAHREEIDQNAANNMNNKLRDSKIFTTIPPPSASSNLKVTNEEQHDFNTLHPRHLYLEKSSNKQYSSKDFNTHEEQAPPVPSPTKDFNNKPRKKLCVEGDHLAGAHSSIDVRYVFFLT